MALNTIVRLRVTEAEAEAWKQAAHHDGISLSDWIRNRCSDGSDDDYTLVATTRPVATKTDLRCARCQRLGLPGCTNCIIPD